MLEFYCNTGDNMVKYYSVISRDSPMMERKEKIIMNKEQFLSAVTANLMTDYRTTLKEAVNFPQRG